VTIVTGNSKVLPFPARFQPNPLGDEKKTVEDKDEDKAEAF